jgi:hypothetical protein
MTVENAVILLVLNGSKRCLRFAGEPVNNDEFLSCRLVTSGHAA